MAFAPPRPPGAAVGAEEGEAVEEAAAVEEEEEAAAVAVEEEEEEVPADKAAMATTRPMARSRPGRGPGPARPRMAMPT